MRDHVRDPVVIHPLIGLQHVQKSFTGTQQCKKSDGLHLCTELALPIQVRHARMTRESRGRETADTQQRERDVAREADVETDRWTKTERKSDRERQNKRKERRDTDQGLLVSQSLPFRRICGH